MSCGQPHELDCREVLEKVYLYLDGECEEGRRAKIKEHLVECGPCLAEFGIEAEVKTLVHRCCGNDAAPDTLRLRVLAKLREGGIEG
ncbi:MAG: mycothiol system anti-sigma-R factor [Actinomycetota bacterium]|nr:mycothiol system anti-sigma-R factor [Actinomycetota bacterium]